ncbi:unnamed protein product [Oppiella nova]|uniref:Uncharacterized protein n=1 Tax=Oppiella nova TaxID=334625 RepID=A0A7R9QX51_9ACAR|nr:unnamed protein product [Oppiella nova]CAG2177254.1 unnamed protein product [Oppiella nova]
MQQMTMVRDRIATLIARRDGRPNILRCEVETLYVHCGGRGCEGGLSLISGHFANPMAVIADGLSETLRNSSTGGVRTGVVERRLLSAGDDHLLSGDHISEPPLQKL